MSSIQVPDGLVDVLVRKAARSLHCASAIARHCPPVATNTIIPTNGPSSWSAHSSIQLVPPKQSDTTDRSLFSRARLAAFDPDGYRKDRGLRRPLFYRSGYLTCVKCNGVTFIDAATLRTIVELKALVDFGGIRPENLPPCIGCGETCGLRIGAHDFLSLLEGGKRALAQRRRLERKAAKILQRAFRLHLRVQWSLAELTRQRTIFLLQYRSAQVIQTMLRGRLGRRVFETEKCLKVVKHANRLLIKHALNHYPHRTRVFWYKNEAEEQQLYSDYRMLIVRTGYRPPRTIVEKNIREIATRVLEREAELVRRIQARWRGLSVRRYLVVFRRELRRQREVRASMVFRIQRTVRRWSHRKRADEWRAKRADGKALEDYVAKRATEHADNNCTDGMTRLCKAYIVERQEELTARLMGHTESKLAGGLKMKAFYESPYGDDVVTDLMNAQVREVLRREGAINEKDAERKARAEWVRRKQLEDPQLAMYFRDEVTARNRYVINKLGQDRRSDKKNVAAALRHNHRTGRNFVFPPHINRDPMAILKERHSMDGQALLRRYSRGAAGC